MTSFADLALAQVESTRYQLTRVTSFSEAWHWLVLVGICLVIAAYVIWMYRRDSRELRKPVSLTLVFLRLSALAGVLFFFLNLERLNEKTLVKNSRVSVIIDTSQSMGLRDDTDASSTSRIEQVIEQIDDQDLLGKLRIQHDLTVYRFDQDNRPTQIAALPRIAKPESDGGFNPDSEALLADAKQLATVAAGLAAASLLGFALFLFAGAKKRRSESDATAWSLLVAMTTLIAGVVVMAVASLRTPEHSLADILGISEPETETASVEIGSDVPVITYTNWEDQLTPRGTRTRMADAIQFVVNKERGGPIAGIVVFTDGRNNAGDDLRNVLRSVSGNNIPIYPIGMGSNKETKNVRIVDIEAPERVYPGDNFKITGYIQTHGYSGQQVTVELVSRTASGNPDDQSPFDIDRELQWTLGENGKTQPIEFEMEPAESGQAKREYYVRVAPPADDSNGRDNERGATVEVVEERSKILLIAGGPTREYRFLRNMLYRDKDIEVHVHLQTGDVGISQESDDILLDLPAIADELFVYDCIVAFDPDWLQLDEIQIELVERWVSEKAGGLIVVAGPVFTPEWSRFRRGRDNRVDTLKSLYPVAFYNQGGATLSLGRFGGDSAWPIQFTDDGLGAEFLWLEDTQLDAEAAWSSFDGVYGYYKVKDPKPGATIYSHFSDPDTSIDGELPIYMAGHFYGAGRVFFQASGEMWRLRAVDTGFFERYYTKLIRWASQGRLLRDSTRGVLLVDRDRCFLGDHIGIQAILTDSQHQPLTSETVESTILLPDGGRQNITLEKIKDANREGMYTGSIVALQQGDYLIEVQVPETDIGELLTREVRVRVPALEIENPRRDDAALQEAADLSNGQYFIADEVGTELGAHLPSVIAPRDLEVTLPGTPDRLFEERLMTWLIVLISGVLCVEWFIRRISRLA